MRLIRSVPVAALIAASATLLMPSAAHAQEVSPTGKGITGGALLGAEAVTLTEAAIGVKPAWPYIVGGIAGAGGGAVGGYFAEHSGNAKLSLYLLAGGMALVIPTTVAILSATAYSPPKNYTEDKGPAPGAPVAEPPQPTPSPAPAPATAPVTTKPTSHVRRTLHRRVALLPREERPLRLYRPMLPPALIGLEPQGLTLSVPAIEVRDTFSPEDRLRYGMKEETELHVPVFNYVF